LACRDVCELLLLEYLQKDEIFCPDVFYIVAARLRYIAYVARVEVESSGAGGSDIYRHSRLSLDEI
jgi:hypothetical protein